MSIPSILSWRQIVDQQNMPGYPHMIFPPEGSIIRRSDIAKVDLPSNN